MPSWCQPPTANRALFSAKWFRLNEVQFVDKASVAYPSDMCCASCIQSTMREANTRHADDSASKASSKIPPDSSANFGLILRYARHSCRNKDEGCTQREMQSRERQTAKPCRGRRQQQFYSATSWRLQCRRIACVNRWLQRGKQEKRYVSQMLTCIPHQNLG
jgi:hypothetical protein